MSLFVQEPITVLKIRRTSNTMNCFTIVDKQVFFNCLLYPLSNNYFISKINNCITFIIGHQILVKLFYVVHCNNNELEHYKTQDIAKIAVELQYFPS